MSAKVERRAWILTKDKERSRIGVLEVEVEGLTDYRRK